MGCVGDSRSVSCLSSVSSAEARGEVTMGRIQVLFDWEVAMGGSRRGDMDMMTFCILFVFVASFESLTVVATSEAGVRRAVVVLCGPGYQWS